MSLLILTSLFFLILSSSMQLSVSQRNVLTRIKRFDSGVGPLELHTTEIPLVLQNQFDTFIVSSNYLPGFITLSVFLTLFLVLACYFMYMFRSLLCQYIRDAVDSNYTSRAVSFEVEYRLRYDGEVVHAVSLELHSTQTSIRVEELRDLDLMPEPVEVSVSTPTDSQVLAINVDQ